MICVKLALLSVLLVTTRGQEVPPPLPGNATMTPIHAVSTGLTSPPDNGTLPNSPLDYDFTNDIDTDFIGSPNCSSKYICEVNSPVYQSYPEKNCYCDILCPLLRECCPGYHPPPEAELPKLSPKVFQCERFDDVTNMPGVGVNMVTKCDDNWHDENIKTYCESSDQFKDTLLRVPVSEPTFNILFRNMYCSFCNFVNDFSNWTISKTCRNGTNIDDCILEFHTPFPNKRTRMCPLNVSDSCDVAIQPGSNHEDVISCTDGNYTLVYSGPEVYRNKHCAACNGVQEDTMLCVKPVLLGSIPDFRTLVDINSGHFVKKGVMFTFDEGESYLSLITLIVSLVALAITFSVYIYFNELLNTPGKILISLIASLFLAQLMFLISGSVEPFPNACKAVSIMVHYFFLAAFCWMNIVALDLWMTFSNQFISYGSENKSPKRFIQFSVYGWMTPLVIVCIAIVVDFSDIDEEFVNLQPRYGTGVCWFNSRDALLLFFVGPLGVFKLVDFVAFIFTSVHIFRAKRQGAMARQKTDMCSFLINVKLSLVMGLTWVFAFLANLGDEPALWYLFIIFNCLQGLFIAVSFLCTNKVQRLVRSKYEDVSGSSKASTQLSSLTPSKDHN